MEVDYESLVHPVMWGYQGPENKYLDIACGAYNFGAAIGSVGTPVFTLLNGMSLGTTGSTRIGRQVTATSLQVKNAIQLDATSTSGVVRTIVFWDLQSNGAAPAIGDLLEFNTATTILMSPLNMSNRDRFVVVWDDIQQLGNTTTYGPSCALQNSYEKCRVTSIYNGGNVGDVTDIQTCALFSCTFGSVGVANPVVRGFYRLRYVDA